MHPVGQLAATMAILVAMMWPVSFARACPTHDAGSPLHLPSTLDQTTGFGRHLHPVLGVERLHEGLDFDGPMGSEVRAAASGTIRHAGVDGSLGQLVVIDHGGGLETRYAHLLARDLPEVGACVLAGARIARIGSTGLSTRPHLHFEVRRDGQAVDPRPLLADR